MKICLGYSTSLGFKGLRVSGLEGMDCGWGQPAGRGARGGIPPALGEPRADMTPNQIALHSRTSALQRRVEERWLAGRVELIQTKAPQSIEQRGEDAVVALRH